MSAVFFFYCGVIAEAFFLIRRKLTILHYILIPATFLFCFLLAMLPSSKESQYDTYLHLFMGAFIFSIVYSVWFKKDILQRVRKEVLFVWFFILLSLIIKDFTTEFFVLKMLVVALSLPQSCARTRMEFLELIRRPDATAASSAAVRLSCIDE